MVPGVSQPLGGGGYLSAVVNFGEVVVEAQLSVAGQMTCPPASDHLNTNILSPIVGVHSIPSVDQGWGEPRSLTLVLAGLNGSVPTPPHLLGSLDGISSSDTERATPPLSGQCQRRTRTGLGTHEPLGPQQGHSGGHQWGQRGCEQDARCLTPCLRTPSCEQEAGPGLPGVSMDQESRCQVLGRSDDRQKENSSTWDFARAAEHPEMPVPEQLRGFITRSPKYLQSTGLPSALQRSRYPRVQGFPARSEAGLRTSVHLSRSGTRTTEQPSSACGELDRHHSCMAAGPAGGLLPHRPLQAGF
ncbi:hypothetical protein H920_01462 [Fukomys damarensis]|uniref:Uncharacterized protein n=1 Tax=Fukomys damarensis TaxID=885580 RepID=A0A091E366_FUKDA|nr:hypothetical protein H920_01462 [Fukomys damarensis]